MLRKKCKTFPGYVEKLKFFGVREGVKGNFFQNPSIGWSENGLREGDLLEGKSAYGYPPLSPPPCPRMMSPKIANVYSISVGYTFMAAGAGGENIALAISSSE